MRRRYIFWEVVALSLALFGSLLDVLAKIEEDDQENSTEDSTAGKKQDRLIFIFVMFLSCSTPVMVLKELVFFRWKKSAERITVELKEKEANSHGPRVVPGGGINQDPRQLAQNGSNEGVTIKESIDIFAVATCTNFFSACFAPFIVLFFTKAQHPDEAFLDFLRAALHELWSNENCWFWTCWYELR